MQLTNKVMEIVIPVAQVVMEPLVYIITRVLIAQLVFILIQMSALL
jgi:hypothetical protein